MSWNRKLWGVEYIGANGEHTLISSAWHDIGRPKFYVGEPTRPLVFCARQQARDWIDLIPSKPSNFRVIRVRETVRKIK